MISDGPNDAESGTSLMLHAAVSGRGITTSSAHYGVASARAERSETCATIRCRICGDLSCSAESLCRGL